MRRSKARLGNHGYASIVVVIFFAGGCGLPGTALQSDSNARPLPPAWPTTRPTPPLEGPAIQSLAVLYAPIVYYVPDEPNLPTNVDYFLSKTSLWFYDAPSGVRLPIKAAPTSRDLHWLQAGIHVASIKRDFKADSYNWRDPAKQCTFYLATVSPDVRKGGPHTEDWTTYYHAYANTIGGITIQYWRFYAFNTGSVGIGNHGGDWECAQVVLSADHKPVELVLLGHRDISVLDWDKVPHISETHPKIYATRGSHTSTIDPPSFISLFIIHDAAYGLVTWPDGSRSNCGPLVNMGEKTQPLNGCFFLTYSGLWGSPDKFPFNNGYWGPAFNETGMIDGFCKAWVGDMANAYMDDCFARGPGK